MKKATYWTLGLICFAFVLMPMVMRREGGPEKVGSVSKAGVLYAGPATEADLASKTYYNVDDLKPCLKKLGSLEVDRDDHDRVQRLTLVDENVELILEKKMTDDQGGTKIVQLGTYVISANGEAEYKMRAFDPEDMPFLGPDDFDRARGKALRLCK